MMREGHDNPIASSRFSWLSVAACAVSLIASLSLGAGCSSSSAVESSSTGGPGTQSCLDKCAEAGGDVATCQGSCSSNGQGGTGGSAGASGGTSSSGGAPAGPQPTLPPTPPDCPALATGTVKVLGQNVELTVGNRREDVQGPVVFYWHGTGSVAGEVALLGPAIQEVADMGGMVASFTTSLGTGTTTGNFVWYTDDFLMADYLLGCAVEQLNIDTRRIFTAGCSAGGLQAGSMVLARSSYLAGAMPNSGGQGFVSMWEDDTHTPSVVTAHGNCSDFVVIYFSNFSRQFAQSIGERGGFAVDCDHGGGHCGSPPDLIAAQWQFLKDHPFGVTTDPYASGLPPSFPSYCRKFPVVDIGPVCQ